MKNISHVLLLVLILLAMACAAPGIQYVQLAYTGNPPQTDTGTIALAPVSDLRQDVPQGYIGKRILTDMSQQTYLVKGLNLADTMTNIIAGYYQKKGSQVQLIKNWDPTPQGILNAKPGFDKYIAAQIIQLECRAQKKGGATKLVLDIQLRLYQGVRKTKTVKTTPVEYTLERTVLSFSAEKLEQFINQSLEEIFNKALL